MILFPPFTETSPFSISNSRTLLLTVLLPSPVSVTFAYSLYVFALSGVKVHEEFDWPEVSTSSLPSSLIRIKEYLRVPFPPSVVTVSGIRAPSLWGDCILEVRVTLSKGLTIRMPLFMPQFGLYFE